jgi:dihydrofolate reductase
MPVAPNIITFIVPLPAPPAVRGRSSSSSGGSASMPAAGTPARNVAGDIPGRHDGLVTKTIYYTATSLDGFIADPDNSLDWLFQVDQGGVDHFAEFMPGVGAFAMGSTTYEWIVAHEQLLDNPDRWQASYGMTPGWVFTHRDLPAIAGANLTFVQGDVRPVHQAMLAVAGDRNIWLIGGGELVGAFADAGLLDEIVVCVTPVTLGAGAPLLPRRILSERLRLTGMEQGGQIAYLTYAVGTP